MFKIVVLEPSQSLVFKICSLHWYLGLFVSSHWNLLISLWGTQRPLFQTPTSPPLLLNHINSLNNFINHLSNALEEAMISTTITTTKIYKPVFKNLLTHDVQFHPSNKPCNLNHPVTHIICRLLGLFSPPGADFLLLPLWWQKSHPPH